MTWSLNMNMNINVNIYICGPSPVVISQLTCIFVHDTHFSNFEKFTNKKNSWRLSAYTWHWTCNGCIRNVTEAVFYTLVLRITWLWESNRRLVYCSPFTTHSCQLSYRILRTWGMPSLPPTPPSSITSWLRTWGMPRPVLLHVWSGEGRWRQWSGSTSLDRSAKARLYCSWFWNKEKQHQMWGT